MNEVMMSLLRHLTPSAECTARLHFHPARYRPGFERPPRRVRLPQKLTQRLLVPALGHRQGSRPSPEVWARVRESSTEGSAAVISAPSAQRSLLSAQPGFTFIPLGIGPGSRNLHGGSVAEVSLSNASRSVLSAPLGLTFITRGRDSGSQDLCTACRLS